MRDSVRDRVRDRVRNKDRVRALPVNKPKTALTPKKVPAIKGDRSTNAPVQ